MAAIKLKLQNMVSFLLPTQKSNYGIALFSNVALFSHLLSWFFKKVVDIKMLVISKFLKLTF